MMPLEMSLYPGWVGNATTCEDQQHAKIYGYNASDIISEIGVKHDITCNTVPTSADEPSFENNENCIPDLVDAYDSDEHGDVPSSCTRKKPKNPAMLCESGKRFQGLQNFSLNDLLDLQVLEEGDARLKKEAKEKRESGPSLLHHKETPAHLKRLKNLDCRKLTLASSHSAEKHVVSNAVSDKSAHSSDYESGSDGDAISDSTQTKLYTVLDEINDVFMKAINLLSRQSVIGFSLEGITIGRQGKACWLGMAVSSGVLLFDITTLGQAAFDHGLKCILENPDILKVIHDCRRVSDLLHHQYSITLVNIFDTQVAAAIVFRVNHNGDWPRYVDGLSSCLFRDLELTPEQVHIVRIRENCREEDQAVWAERPCSRGLLEIAVKQVVHLRDLRLVLMEKMMAEFVAGVDIYLTSVRDANKDMAKSSQLIKHLLPNAFQHLKINSSQWRRRPMYAGVGSQRDKSGFIENCDGVSDPYVISSRDSVWHQPMEAINAGKADGCTKRLGRSLPANSNFSEALHIREKNETKTDRTDCSEQLTNQVQSFSHKTEVSAGSSPSPIRASQSLISPSIQARQPFISPTIRTSQSLVSPALGASPSLASSSIQASQSLGNPSILANQSLVSPPIRASQSLVSPSIRASQSLVSPSIRASQSLVRPSIRASQSLVSPSIRASQSLVSAPVQSQSTETSGSKERVQTFMSLIQSDSASHINRSPSGSDSENLIFCPAGAEIGEIYTQKPKSRGSRTTYQHCSSEGNLQRPYEEGTMDSCFDSIPSPGMRNEMNKQQTREDTRTTVTSDSEATAHAPDKSDIICSPEVQRPKPFGSNPSSPLGMLNAVLGNCSPKS